MAGVVILEGLISVDAALRAGARDVETVYVARTRPDRALHNMERAAEAAGVPVEHVDRDTVDAKATGTSHGGVIATGGPRRFLDPSELIAGRTQPCVVMLDGIEDPFNLGQAIRALYAAGVDGLVLRPREWGPAEATVVRSSAGASELMPTALAETALEAAAFYRGQGLTVACTAQRDATSIYASDLTGPLFLLIGGERRGITRSFLDQADVRVEIPYAADFRHSLGAAAAAAVIAFEIARQRRAGGS